MDQTGASYLPEEFVDGLMETNLVENVIQDQDSDI